MAIYNDYGWCRVEGCAVSNVRTQYGTPPYTAYPFVNIPVSIRIFYGQPEIQIFNPNSSIQHVIYKVVPLSELNPAHASDYDTITDIDANYNNLAADIGAYSRQIVKDDTVNSANYYFKPFVLTRSSVIFYDQDTATQFTNTQTIIIDNLSTPKIIAITGGYIGPPVEVGGEFLEDNLNITAVYEDGNTAILRQGYNIVAVRDPVKFPDPDEPGNKVVTEVGVNVFRIEYETPQGQKLTCTVSVSGIKKLEGIEAYYDGPTLAVGNKVERKYVVVIAKYSDNSSATITDYTFPNGNVVSEANQGNILIVYKGFETILDVNMYDVASVRLTAYYNGPPVEIGYEYDIQRCSIRVSYKSEDGMNGGWENIDPDACIFSTTTVEHEGLNNVLVAFDSRYGRVTTYMAVTGTRPERKLARIEAVYNGPEIVQSDLSLDPPYIETFSVERIICKAYYTDGSVETVRNFMVNQNYVTNVGENVIRVTYRNQHDEEAETFVIVIGLEKDDTMMDGSYELDLDNYYPEATRLNNRYRGPAESYKHSSYDKMMLANIRRLYSIFASIEADFNAIVESMDGQSAIKLVTIHSIHELCDNTEFWRQDSRFTNGYYVQSEG